MEDDVVFEIFSFLSTKEILTSSSTCKQFHNISNYQLLWKQKLKKFTIGRPLIFNSKNVKINEKEENIKRNFEFEINSIQNPKMKFLQNVVAKSKKHLKQSLLPNCEIYIMKTNDCETYYILSLGSDYFIANSLENSFKFFETSNMPLYKFESLSQLENMTNHLKTFHFVYSKISCFEKQKPDADLKELILLELLDCIEKRFLSKEALKSMFSVLCLFEWGEVPFKFTFDEAPTRFPDGTLEFKEEEGELGKFEMIEEEGRLTISLYCTFILNKTFEKIHHHCVTLNVSQERYILYRKCVWKR
jgi:hypothetical protein